MLELKDIVKFYGQDDNKVVALNGVSLCFRKNEFVSILGPSGCGKTTLLNIIGGLDRYTSGDIRIEGVSTKEYKDRDWDVYRNHSIGFVFQGYNLIPHLTVLENVEMSLNIGGVDTESRRAKALEVLQKVGLAGQEKKLPNQLSGGQMQRVAIARALITDPEIILADEPTGALDSVISLQVMDLLKEVAAERLVIMVTHNPQLAEKYSTRIINLCDGKVVGDTNAYAPEKSDPARVITGKTAMSFWTAVKSSLKNLVSKRARTILTCVASSIGIIGIALILSVSNGMSAYMNSMQVDSLGEFPIAISSISADMEKLMSMTQKPGANMQAIMETDLPLYPEDQTVKPYLSSITSILRQLVTYSDISEEFMDYLYKIDKKQINAIQCYRDINTHISVKDDYDFCRLMDLDASGWQEIIDNYDYMKTQYDVINGASFPKEANEIAIVVDQYNRLSVKILDALGVEYTDAGEGMGYLDVPFERLAAVEMGIIWNDDFYQEKNGVYTEKGISHSAIPENAYRLKITAILRAKEGTNMMWLTSGVAHTPALTETIIAHEKTSAVALAQTQEYNRYLAEKETDEKAILKDVLTGRKMTNEWSMLLGLVSAYSFVDAGEVVEITDETMYNEAMRKLGGTELPSVVMIYPSGFQYKSSIVEYLNAYNEGKEEDNKVTVTDSTTAMIGMVQSMIDAITYVLIAFSAISLLVSSVMIGIITYVSVMERTKEIGVLRAMGARKLDITRIFNAETLLIGLVSGILAIVVTYLLDMVISLVLQSLTGIVGLAVLSPLNALILVCVCVFLTVTAGFIPAVFASRKDPVNALRTE